MVRRRCGGKWRASQMRCTELSEMPIASAITRPVQWVASCGGRAQVTLTTLAVVSTAIGALPGLRVLPRRCRCDRGLRFAHRAKYCTLVSERGLALSLLSSGSKNASTSTAGTNVRRFR